MEFLASLFIRLLDLLSDRLTFKILTLRNYTFISFILQNVCLVF